MAESDISRRLSLQPTSSLPLPRALRQNKSFTQLARFIGFSATDDKQSATESGSDADEGAEDDAAMSTAGDDDDQDAEVDEESLMWDAQVRDFQPNHLLSLLMIRLHSLRTNRHSQRNIMLLRHYLPTHRQLHVLRWATCSLVGQDSLQLRVDRHLALRAPNRFTTIAPVQPVYLNSPGLLYSSDPSLQPPNPRHP